MKWICIAVGVLVGLPLAFIVMMYAASELGGEVAVLHRTSADGSVDRVRVWIVEDGATAWVEHGMPDAPWIVRLPRDSTVTLERNGTPLLYRASADLESHARYHALRRQRYGFASQLVDWLGGDADTCQGTPVRLEPHTP